MKLSVKSNKLKVKSPLRLWFGVGGGPVIYAIHLVVAYALQTLSCQWRFLQFTILGMHALSFTLIVFTIVAATAVLYGAYLSYGDWVVLRELDNDRANKPERERHQFMVYAGFTMSIFFAIVILLSIVPSLMLGICAQATPIV